MQSVLATTHDKPAADEAILLELVNAKTSEAVAQQELEEVKGKLDSLRKMLGAGMTDSSSSGHRPSPSEPVFLPTSSYNAAIPSTLLSNKLVGQENKVIPSSQPAASSGGGLFSGWGRRTPSTSVLPTAKKGSV